MHRGRATLGGAAGGRRLRALHLGALAGAAGLCLAGSLAAPASAASGTAAAAATTPAAAAGTAPGAPATVPAPAVPPVPQNVTDGQDATSLLRRAVALTSVGTSQAPLEATLARAQAQLIAQTVAADRATAAAATATAAAGEAARRARSATASAASLQGALREAALRLYMGGAEASIAPITSLSDASLDEITDAGVYEGTILSPDGILAERGADAAQARHEASQRRAQEAAALRDQALARRAQGEATTALDQIKAELAALGATTATLVSAERSEVSAQAGHSLTGPASLEFTPAAPLPAPLSTTSVALAWAFSELGKPYLWGGTGPGAFDCSGLTQYVWAKAGVAIPRVAAAQDAWTVPVPLSQLLPGDLVFYGTTDIHHVGIYIGDGLMINAPHTGAFVSITSIWWSDLAGFGRVHDAGVPVPSRTLPSPADPAPPVVQPAVGAVPSESKPPPGYVAPPGATAPVVVSPVPTSTGPATTLPTGPTSTTTAPGPSTTTTTVPGSTTTSVPESTTTTTVPDTSSTTTGSILGLGG